MVIFSGVGEVDQVTRFEGAARRSSHRIDDPEAEGRRRRKASARWKIGLNPKICGYKLDTGGIKGMNSRGNEAQRALFKSGLVHGPTPFEDFTVHFGVDGDLIDTGFRFDVDTHGRNHRET